MPFDDLFAEAERQLNICNSCRYCAGYCPVWPALETRTELSREDVTHLANLCHDCQACLTACMYSPPHEFAVNPPQVFAAVREDTYRRYVWPGRAVPARRKRLYTAAAFLAACIVLTVLALLTGTSSIFARSGAKSPYELLPHAVLLCVVLVPAVFTAAVMARAAWRYWQDIDGRPRGLLNLRAWTRSLGQAATLRHQGGAGEGCSAGDGEPSDLRRGYHHLVAYGFLLTVFATVSAWILQTFLGDLPPYPLLSAPVIFGTIGGISASAGCAGLLRLERRAGRLETTESMRRADHALLWALLTLMISGLIVLATRTTSLYAPVLALHLAAVIVAFAIAPYSKFFHWVYRLLSIQHDNLEAGARR